MPRGVYKRTKSVWNKGKKNPYSKITLKRMRKSHLGYVMPESQKRKIGKAESGNKHYNWKGGISYKTPSRVHRWVVKEKGRAKNYICEQCKRRHAFDWSNINHKYKRILSDYRALCRPCHIKWDRAFNNRK